MKRLLTVVCILTIALAGSAFGGAIITNGAGLYMGINNEGHHNVPDGTGGVSVPAPGVSSGFVGIFLAGVGDATSPGCQCEGFGFAGNGIAGWASVDNGFSNVSLVSFASAAATATSVVNLTSLPGLMLTHDYYPSSSSALFEGKITIANTSGATITDVRYNRTMDWDVPPTEFNEFVTIGGWPASALLHSGNDGFATPNPLMVLPLIGTPGAVADGNFTDAGPADHGAAFTFAFGDLAAGATKEFYIYYGAAPNEAAALAALASVGAEVYSLGQPNVPGKERVTTFMFGFKGVGGTPIVPEPGTYIMLGSGLVALLFARRFRK